MPGVPREAARLFGNGRRTPLTRQPNARGVRTAAGCSGKNGGTAGSTCVPAGPYGHSEVRRDCGGGGYGRAFGQRCGVVDVIVFSRGFSHARLIHFLFDPREKRLVGFLSWLVL